MFLMRITIDEHVMLKKIDKTMSLVVTTEDISSIL
jgi:hypothetical protein